MAVTFPALVYKGGGPYLAPGGYYDYKQVADQTAYDAALASGWKASLSEVVTNPYGMLPDPTRTAPGTILSQDGVEYICDGVNWDALSIKDYTADTLPDPATLGAGAPVVVDGKVLLKSGDGFAGVSPLSVDVVVYGATPGGIAAAVAAKKRGASVIVINPSEWVGGMVTGGLSLTDFHPSQSSHTISGFAKKFFERVGENYGIPWQQFYRLSANATPRVYQKVMSEMISENDINIIGPAHVVECAKIGTTIKSIQLSDGQTIFGKQFIDSTYEGDLLALAGCTTTIGRESSAQYGESYAGVQPYGGGSGQFTSNFDPYVIPGNPASGLLPGIQPDAYGTVGDASPYVMAGTFRLCLTNVGSRRITFTEPEGYNAADFELLGRYIQAEGSGWTTFDQMVLLSNLQGSGAQYTVDANSRKAVSIDFHDPTCTEYITATHERRAEIRAKVKYWIQGLFWFLKTDSRIPAALKADVANWGYCKDEFQQFGGFSPEYYVREGRRLVGDFVMKQSDLDTAKSYGDGVAFLYYPVDSHSCKRVYVPGTGVRNEGGGSSFDPIAGNPIPIRVLFPKATECTNLQATFAVSASHVAFCSIRMEPTSMSLGEAAGVGAAIAASYDGTIQGVDYKLVQKQIDYQGNLAIDHGAIISADGTTYTGGTRTLNGTWNAAGVFGYIGYSHFPSSTVGNYIDFAPNIKRTGMYKVLLNWPDPQTATRSQTAPITITHAGGTTSITVNQMADGSGGNWFDAGDYVFQAGTPSTHKVRVGVSADATSTVIAAVKFIPV